MNKIISILEAIPDDVSAYLVFSDGKEMELSNFEMTDESIYNRSDLCCADVIKQIVCDKRFFTPGTKMEFSVHDIKEIKSVKEKKVLFSSNEI